MAKFCGNCGSSAEDDARVCGNCGTPFDGAGPVDMGGKAAGIGGIFSGLTGSFSNPDKLKKLIVAGIALVVAILVVVGVVNVIKNNTGTNAIIKQQMKALETGKGGGKLVKYLPEYEKEEDDYDEDDTRDDLEDEYESEKDYYEDEYGKYKVKYEIKSEKKLSKKKVEDFKEYLEEIYPDYDTDRITAIKEVKVKVTIKGEDDTEKDTWELTFIKEDGKWKSLDLYI